MIGDLHIPQRSTGVPDQFKELLLPNKMQYVLSPGNIGCKEVSLNDPILTLCLSDPRMA